MTVDYGHDGWTVPFDLSADPASVLAEYAMSRVIARARSELGRNASTMDFLKRFHSEGNHPGNGSGERKALERLLKGDAAVRLDEFLRWCHAFKMEPASLLGRGLADKEGYPPLFRAALDIPDAGPPRFRSTRWVDWDSATRTCQAELEGFADAVGSSFVTSSVAVVHMVLGLVGTGVNPALLKNDGSNTVMLLEPTRTILTARTYTSDDEEDWQALLECLLIPPSDYLLIVLGQAGTARLAAHLPGLPDLRNDENYEIPDQAYENSGADVLERVQWRATQRLEGHHLTLQLLQRKSSNSTLA